MRPMLLLFHTIGLQASGFIITPRNLKFSNTNTIYYGVYLTLSLYLSL